MAVELIGNFSSTTPAAPTGRELVKPQTDSASPENYSFSVANAGGVNVQTGTSYAIQESDNGKVVVFTNTAAKAVSIPHTLSAKFRCGIVNLGAADATLTPVSGNINGVASITVSLNSGAQLYFDATNFYALKGGSTSPSGSGFVHSTGGIIDSAAVDIIEPHGICIDGGVSTPSTGSKGYWTCPFAGTIVGWRMIADVAGSVQITVKKSSDAGFPTTASIVASAPPTLTAQQKNSDAVLSGWTAAVAVNDVFEFNLDSVTTCKRFILELLIKRS